jgi:hypothetical protein
MNVFELNDYNSKNLLETETYSELDNKFQSNNENSLFENFEENNFNNNININLKNLNEVNNKIEKNSLIIRQFFKIIEYKLLDFFKQNNNTNKLIHIINTIFHESSDIFINYITQNIANFLLNSLSNNINDIQNDYDNNKTDFLIKKMTKKKNSLKLNNIILTNKINNKYIEINGDKDIQKNINKILMTRNKQQLKKKFTLVQGSRSEHYLIPDNGINYRYYYYNSNNYCNKVYLKCSDKKCSGKIKMNMNNLEYIFLHNHNKEYKEHSYFKLDN